MTSIIAIGFLLFQVGRSAALRSEAQTAADAAALAGAKALAGQLPGLEDNSLGLSDAAARAAAIDYADRNEADLVSFEVRGLDVLVEVRTEEALGSEAEEVDAEGRRGFARARARIAAPSGPCGGPPTGSIEGDIDDAIALANSLGLGVTSGLRPEDLDSLHSLGIAADVAGPPEAMARFYCAALRRYKYIEELFYDPIGGVDKNIPIPAIGGHDDHVHIAMLGPPIGAGQGGKDDTKGPNDAGAPASPDTVPLVLLVAYDDDSAARGGAFLGGPYAIPTYIVMCESGGDYSALNPTSGAGGAYQILPSTWRAYGGKGLPHQASKAEQDRIAALIWENDGPSAWVCA